MFFSPSSDEQLRGRHFGDKSYGSMASGFHYLPIHQSLACGIPHHSCKIAAPPSCFVPTFQAKRRGRKVGKRCVSVVSLFKKKTPFSNPTQQISSYISVASIVAMVMSSCVKVRGIEIFSWALEVLLVTQPKIGAILPVRISALQPSGYLTVDDSFSVSSCIKWR